MFERLVGKILDRILSKYFVSPDNTASSGNNGDNNLNSTFGSISSSATSLSRSSRLGVWSGYISLENLELRKDIVNDILRKKGLPLELIHCSIRRLEITIPWAKLGLSSSSSSRTPQKNKSRRSVRDHYSDSGDSADDAFIIIVIDGVNILFRTNYEYDDDALRQEATKKRQQQLQEETDIFDSLSAGGRDTAYNQNENEGATGTSSSTWTGSFQERLQQRLIKDIIERFQLHIRDVHVRLEDVTTDPSNPFATGLTLESLHIQADDDTSADEVPQPTTQVHDGSEIVATMCKVAQLNHFAIYWNALDYTVGQSKPGLSILHKLKNVDSMTLSQYLDRCIARRATAISTTTSPLLQGEASSPPQTSTSLLSLHAATNHSYILLPVDGTLRATLVSADNPLSINSLKIKPMLDAKLHIDEISVQLRDFQCSQILTLVSTVKEHNFTKQYRIYRPFESVKENPKAWWNYAIRVIQNELQLSSNSNSKENSNSRWSWKRFHKRFATRSRYCNLYQRYLEYHSTSGHTTYTPEGGSKVEYGQCEIGAFEDLGDDEKKSGDGFVLDDSVSIAAATKVAMQSSLPRKEGGPLSQAQLIELKQLEDGIVGDISIHDIILFRAVVSARLSRRDKNHDAKTTPIDSRSKTSKKQSIYRRLMSSVVSTDEIDSQDEVERLLAYMEENSAVTTTTRTTTNEGESNNDASLGDDIVIVEGEDDFESPPVALSFKIQLDKGSIVLFSPLSATTEMVDQHRRLHERFLDLQLINVNAAYTVLGSNLDSYRIDLSLFDFVGSEIRSNRNEYVIMLAGNKKRSISDQNRHETGPTQDDEEELLGSYPIVERQQTLPRSNKSPHASYIFRGQQRQQQPFHLLTVEFASKPPQSPECDVGINTKLDLLEIIMTPECEWIQRIKNLASSVAKSTKTLTNKASFWENLSMARINSLDSAVAELQAKVDTALSDYKNLDVDIQINCPILRIADGRGRNIVLDLGYFHLATERLAGVATRKLNYSALRDGSKPRCYYQSVSSKDNNDDETLATNGTNSEAIPVPKTNSFDSNSASRRTSSFDGSPNLHGLESSTRSLKNMFLGSSAMSLASGGSYGRSTTLNEGITAAGGESFGVKNGESQWMSGFLNSCFYDVFRLRLYGSQLYMEEIEIGAREYMINNLEISTTLEKSIIPTDHTLCRFKANCLVDNFIISVSESSIQQLGVFMKEWKQVFLSKDSSMAVFGHLPDIMNGAHQQQINGRMSIRKELQGRADDSQPNSPFPDDSRTLSSSGESDIDESEFLDALDGELGDGEARSSFVDEHNWIDFASGNLGGLDGTNRMANSMRQRRRRRNRSVSDVSSISDRSLPQKAPAQHQGGNYLSAENLARLDESGIEEDAELDSDNGSFDSFESAYSNESELGEALRKNIERVEQDLQTKKYELSELLITNRNRGTGPAQTRLEDAERQKKGRALKLDIDRMEAEARELRAAHQDLEAHTLAFQQAQVVRSPGKSKPMDSTVISTNTSEGQSKDEQSVISQRTVDPALRAKAILRSRKQRSLHQNEEDLGHAHNLTSRLNRALYQVSITFSSIRVDIHDASGLSLYDEGLTDEKPLSYQFGLSRTSLSILSRDNDTKMFLGVDSISAGTKSFRDLQAPTNYLLLGGPQASRMDRLMPYQFPQLIASNTTEEKMLSVTVLKSNRAASNDKAIFVNTIKAKILVGDVEIFPDPESLSSVVSFCTRAKNEILPDELLRAKKTPSNAKDAPRSSIVRKVCNDMMTSMDNRKSSPGSKSYIDIAIEFSSLRLKLLTRRKQLVGGFVLTSTKLRFGRELACAFYKCRSQLEIRCQNIQLLQLCEVESGVARELIGRRDPYEAIFHMKLRNQLVPSSEPGGWVVERGFLKSRDVVTYSRGKAAWNLHCGAQLSSLNVVASMQTIDEIIHHTKELASSFQTQTHHADQSIDRAFNDDVSRNTRNRSQNSSNGHPLADLTPIRWRADFLLPKVSIVLPSQQSQEWSLPDNSGHTILVKYSLHLSTEESPTSPNALAFRFVVNNFSCVRSSDSWHILEPTGVVCELVTKMNSLDSKYFPPLRLNLPRDSPWQDAAIGNEECIEESKADLTNENNTSLSVTITPLKMNLSSEACSLLIRTVKELNKRKMKDSAPDNLVHHKERKQPFLMDLKLVVLSLELKLLRESTTSSSKKCSDPLVGLSVQRAVVIANRNSRGGTFSLQITDASLDDLTSLPGVRVAGKQYAQGDDAPRETPIANVLMSFNETEVSSVVASAEISLGHVQFIPVPSVLSSILSLESHLQDTLSKIDKEAAENNLVDRPTESQNDISSSLKMPFKDVLLGLSFDIAGVEVILSSRDILSHIKDRSDDPIAVVALRSKLHLGGTIAISEISSLDCLVRVIDAVSDSATYAKAPKLDWHEVINSHMNGEADAKAKQTSPGISAKDWRISNALAGSVNLSLEEFQTLRTSIKRVISRKSGGTTHQSLVQRSPYRYVLSPQAGGEQRITNRIFCKASHRLFGTTLEIVAPGSAADSMSFTKISQAFQLEVGFVDILLYIRQSTGGINDAIRVTIRPILEIIQRKKTTSKNPKDGDGQDSYVMNLVASATTIACIQGEGFQVTCVPGGATRLTESPIAKCTFSDFEVGCAAAPVEEKSRALLSPGSEAEKDVLSEAWANLPLSSLTFGAWIRCEISASYHNRRLVAWEPVVEPWTLDAKVGLDLVQLLRMKPSKLSTGSRRRNREHDIINTPQPHSSLAPVTPTNEALKNDRLSAIGRLLRSPFATNDPKQAESTSLQNTIELHADLSYRLLASTESKIIHLSLYPPLRSDSVDTERHPLLPCRPTMTWLHQFGFPFSNERQKDTTPPAICFSMSDAKPLNINITGALIESSLVFIGQQKEEIQRSRTLAPHWIRNDTGMTIRFREILDLEREQKGEKATKTILPSGREIPLSLRRAISQSCDPHRGHIAIELGSFDSNGRPYGQGHKPPQISIITRFEYFSPTNIPVDTVGIQRYPMVRNIDSATREQRVVGWIIVRVELRGGMKVVVVESPLLLKNNADTEIVCEVRDRGVGLPLLWRAVVPRARLTTAKDTSATHSDSACIPVPIDIVPAIDKGSSALSVIAFARNQSVSNGDEVVDDGSHQTFAVRVSVPRPYSEKSIKRGVTEESQISLAPYSIASHQRDTFDESAIEFLHVNVCSLRIGTYSDGGNKPTFIIPEQRMLFFRPPVVVKNQLPFDLTVQIRKEMKSRKAFNEWETLGNLPCGESINWTGADALTKLELRVKICEKSRRQPLDFPSWSLPIAIPSEYDIHKKRRTGANEPSMHLQMVLEDSLGVSLPLSVNLSVGTNIRDSDAALQNSTRVFATALPEASRVISIFVPFWIINSTGSRLEFSANTAVAGVMSKSPGDEIFSPLGFMGSSDDTKQGNQGGNEQSNTPLGLAELLEEDEAAHLVPRPSFEVWMIGDDKAARMSIRRRISCLDNGKQEDFVSPWSEPIALREPVNAHHNILVSPPEALIGGRRSAQAETFALRSNIVNAPERFGGSHGTKFLHIVNRYAIVNELGRDVEVISEGKGGAPLLFKANSRPKPFHFDDSDRICIRPREFGWGWSGAFSIKKKRREVVIRLKHKLKGHVIIVSLEIFDGQKSPGNVLVFRKTNHPPFRLENHTMHPLHFGQSSTFNAEEVALDSLLLPYHSADFAWDRPDDHSRSVVLTVADLAYSSDPSHYLEEKFLGNIYLDEIAPGTEIKMRNRTFSGQIATDGATRVLRITDTSLPALQTEDFRSTNQTNIFNEPNSLPPLHQWLEVNLSYGIGVSLVDWSPQELIYIKFDDVKLERVTHSGQESMSISVGCFSIDNQLWVTPYPVLLKMGQLAKEKGPSKLGYVEKLRRNRNNAVVIKWSRKLNSRKGQDGLTLFHDLEVFAEPELFLNIDGCLTDRLLGMARQAVGSGSASSMNLNGSKSRDDVLHYCLGISDYRNTPSATPGIVDNSCDAVTTAVMAARLRVDKSHLRTKSREHRSHTSGVGHAAERQKQGYPTKPLTKARPKYYIDKLRVSTFKAEISWTGSLPVSVSGFIRPAFTFEGLPVLLRHLTCSHIYGTVDDHVQTLKSHYVSIWRILDVLVGLTFKPTFIVRAFIYTTRETIASICDWWSAKLRNTGESFLGLTSSAIRSQSAFRSEELSMKKTIPVYHAVIGNFASLSAMLFLGSAGFSNAVASFFHYSGMVESSGRQTRGSVRTRDPRLFANVDGKDLLVEYEEGENTGKAILSRVRMGLHLGEGYICHLEGIHYTREEQIAAIDKTPLICMMTSDRVMILNGKRDENFAEVFWESTFENIVLFESENVDNMMVDTMKFWYMLDKDNLESSTAMDDTGPPSNGISNRRGLDLLRCKAICAPLGSAAMLREKLSALNYGIT